MRYELQSRQAGRLVSNAILQYGEPDMTKTIFFLCWLGASAVLTCCCLAADTFTPENFNITEVMIPMADGGKLSADVYLPGKERYPTILTITSSPKSRCRLDHYPRSDFFNSGDYAVVCVERRGSEGSSDNPPRPQVNPDGHDGYDVIEWIARQPWSNGRTGMWGASNQGLIQYATAMANPPHLTCIMPAETTPRTREPGSLGMDYEQLFPGGVLRLEMVQRTDRPRLSQRRSPIVQKLARHAVDDGFFDKRPDGAPTLEDVKVPVMAVGSWFDNDKNRATVDLFQRILTQTPQRHTSDHRLLIGPWTHDGVYIDGEQGQLQFNNASKYYRMREKQFFDRWLRDIPLEVEDVSPISYYLMGKNQWRTTEGWPPAGTKDVSFYLHPDRELSRRKPTAKSPPGRFVSNPDNPTPTVGGQNKSKNLGKGPFDQTGKVETHEDVLIFTSSKLREDLSVVGDIKVKLFISSDSEDTDVAFRLTDVYPAGAGNPAPRSMLLRDGILRMSLSGSRKQYSFLKPGEIYPADIETIPIAWTFLKGHRIRLIISASNYPRWDVNTNTRDKSGKPKIAVSKLYHDPDYPSRLILSVIEDHARLAPGQSHGSENRTLRSDARPQTKTGSGWVDWRGPNRHAISDLTPNSLPEKPTFLWRHPMTGMALAGIAATDEYVVVPDKSEDRTLDIFRCFDAQTGKQLWTIEYPAPEDLEYSNSPRANPVISDGNVYLLGAFGDLSCARIDSGEIVWQKNIVTEFGAKLPSWGMSATPLLTDGKLIVNPGAPDASLVALNPRTGAVIWKSPGPPAAYASFIVATFGGVRQIVGYDVTSAGGWLPDTGKRIWTLSPGEEGDFNVPTPVEVEGKLLLATENNAVRLYDFGPDGKINPEPVAENFDLLTDCSTPVVVNDLVFGGAYNDLLCLDLKNGLKTAWSVVDRVFGDYYTLIADSKHVLATTVSGYMVLFEADKTQYKEKARLKVLEENEIFSHPALMPGKLYIRSHKEICCIELDN